MTPRLDDIRHANNALHDSTNTDNRYISYQLSLISHTKPSTWTKNREYSSTKPIENPRVKCLPRRSSNMIRLSLEVGSLHVTHYILVKTDTGPLQVRTQRVLTLEWQWKVLRRKGTLKEQIHKTYSSLHQLLPQRIQTDRKQIRCLG